MKNTLKETWQSTAVVKCGFSTYTSLFFGENSVSKSCISRDLSNILKLFSLLCCWCVAIYIDLTQLSILEVWKSWIKNIQEIVCSHVEKFSLTDEKKKKRTNWEVSKVVMAAIHNKSKVKDVTALTTLFDWQSISEKWNAPTPTVMPEHSWATNHWGKKEQLLQRQCLSIH